MKPPRSSPPVLTSLLVLTLVSPAAAFGQIVAESQPFTVPRPEDEQWPPGTADVLSDPAVAALAGGGFVHVAARRLTNAPLGIFAEIGFGRLIGPGGEIGPAFGFGGRSLDHLFSVERPRVVADGAGGFTVVWHQVRPGASDIALRRFGPGAVPLTDDVAPGPFPDLQADVVTSVAGNAAGRFAIGYREVDLAAETTTLKLRVFLSTGEPVSPEITLAGPLPGRLEHLGVAIVMDAAGRVVAAWPEDERLERILVGRFRPGGSPLGEPFQLIGPVSGPVALTGQPDGSYTVAWVVPGSIDPQSDLPPWLVMAGFDAQSRQHAPLTGVDTIVGAPPVLSADVHGNLIVLWHGTMPAVSPRVALYDRRLIFQDARTFEFATTPNFQGGVALSDGGRALLAWSDQALLSTARRDADPCLHRPSGLWCAAGRGGASPEELHVPGATFLFPREVPLLADLDGDGRDDLCVHRGRSFLCDTAHDGGGAELTTPAFGHRGEPQLAGDVDGDGRDEACVRRGNRFLCDTGHDGGAAERAFAFGTPADVALLGDADGDGRDDVCVFRDRRYLCDTARDGGAAERRFDLRPLLPAGAYAPFLGDLDGDGDDEACVAASGRFTCFAAGPDGTPGLVLDRPWGFPGDLPLFGDVDGF